MQRLKFEFDFIHLFILKDEILITILVDVTKKVNFIPRLNNLEVFIGQNKLLHVQRNLK
jgi:hypothetical protein